MTNVQEPKSAQKQRVLVITGDPIGQKVAGPAIRAWNIAKFLADKHDVTLISLNSVSRESHTFEVVYVSPHDPKLFNRYEAWADVILFQGHAMEFFRSLQRSKKILIADVYAPMHLEQLEQARSLPLPVWTHQIDQAVEVLNQQMARADFFICASERQRTFYLGQLASLGRLNPANYREDPDFRRLIDVVPFGLPREFPAHDNMVLKGVLPGIALDDKVLLWSGGLYNWFDPKTLLRAVAILFERHPNVRLFFQGTKHPNSGVPEMGIVAESRNLARELGLLNVSVFFNTSWVNYSERHNYLAEADVGVSTHFDHIETTMAFRTRILDYLWASVPIVATDGDYFAELIEREGLGKVVTARDEIALANALEKALFDEAYISEVKANLNRVREEFYWDRVLQPLGRFVDTRLHASDSAAAIERAHRAPVSRPAPPARQTFDFKYYPSRVIFHLRRGGAGALVRAFKRAVSRFQRRIDL